MADLFHGNTPSRGIQNHGGGSYDQSSMQDIMDGDSMQGGLTSLVGVAAAPDAINPHTSGNYIIDSTAVDPITLGLPTSEVDDGLSVSIYSDSAFAHTVTLPSAQFKTGTATPKTIATFAAFAGAGMTLRAMDGSWHVISVASGTSGTNSVTFT
jgi:hypothetical protein